MSDPAALSERVRRGFMWKILGTTTLRLGSLITGIALARILAPHEFGLFAIALTIQAILQNFAELGLAADLIRHGDIDRRGPTVTTLSLIASGTLVAIMCITAGPVATAMGGPGATPVIQLMSVTVLLSGLSSVPFAHLQRDFKQRTFFLLDALNLVLSTVITITLALLGWGAISLAIGRVVAQSTSTVLQYVVTRRKLRFGWNPEVARSGIRFGLPYASAGLLSMVLLNLDNIVVGHVAGSIVLGFYVLAFNISSWPTSVVGSAVSAVAMPAFAQRSLDKNAVDVQGLIRSTALTWAMVLPIGAGLAILARPTIYLLYGARWTPAAVALAGLGVFGAIRVVFDLWVAFLTATGKVGALLWTQAAWLLALIPTMYIAVRWHGLAGAAWSHVAVGFVLILPLYLVAIHRAGAPEGAVLRTFIRPVLAVIPASAAAWYVTNEWLHTAIWQLFVGGLVLVLIYVGILWPYLRREPLVEKQIRRFRRWGRRLDSDVTSA